jgi:hypothetical protein
MNNFTRHNRNVRAARRNGIAALLVATGLLALTGCGGGGNGSGGNWNAIPEEPVVTRPCGQEAPCPSITLESPAAWPEGDPAGEISLSASWQTGPGYLLDEYFISGRANVFNYNQAEAEMGEHPGDNLVVRLADMPYKTRILMAYPEQKERFNGVVIIELMNSTAGYDNAPVWVPSAEFFRREGFVYIGITTSGDQSVAYLKSGCGRDRPACGERYAGLSLEDNGLEFEIVSQLASALKSGTPDQSPLPIGFNPIEMVFVTGYSQQAQSVITLSNQFHQDAIDGYFPQGFARGRPIGGRYNGLQGVNGDPLFCGQPDSASYPDCIGSLAASEPQLRSNLPAPVYQGMTEHDVVFMGGFAHRQPDIDVSSHASFRLIEVPGSGHVPSMLGALEVAPGYRRADLCVNQPGFNNTPVAAVDAYSAYWRAMILQVREGRIPPNAPRIETDEMGGIVRDSWSNALGGLRMPEFQFPRASYFQPSNVIKPVCTEEITTDCLPAAVARLGGMCFQTTSVMPFTNGELAELYPDRDRYVAEYTEYTLQLVAQGFLLEEDAQKRLLALDSESR